MRDPLNRPAPSTPYCTFRMGIVTALAPLRVQVADRVTVAARCASYAPTVGAHVLVLFDMGAATVIDRIVND